jgi:hypothetical protein
MKFRPTALAWIDLDVSAAPDWDRAQIRRLARHLDYALVWPAASPVLLVDQAHAADVDAVMVPSPAHLHPIMLNTLMGIADVEMVLPRMSFARWALTHPAGRFG